MSVYTHVTRTQLDDFFSHYHLGAVISYTGIKEGMVNSNYFVTTTQGEFVLTLFEDMTDIDVDPVVKLLRHLADNQLCVPCPQHDRHGQPLKRLNHKTALLCQRLVGTALITPTLEHCTQIGLQLAKLHTCTQGYLFPTQNPNNLTSLKRLFDSLVPQLSNEDKSLVDNELAFQNQHNIAMPMGLIHADLFRDNVLFESGQFSGMLDFYSACHGELLFDVAIAVNDWCCDDGVINPEKIAALLSAYQCKRPLEVVEQQRWSVMLRRAALRFWLARLAHQNRARTGELVQQKDPLAFRRILVQHQA